MMEILQIKNKGKKDKIMIQGKINTNMEIIIQDFDYLF